MPVEPINSFDEYKTIINSGKPVVINYWATWCGPCKTFAPTYEHFSDEAKYNKSVKFYKVDVDAQPEITEQIETSSLPTFEVFKDGIRIDEYKGYHVLPLQILIEHAVSAA